MTTTEHQEPRATSVWPGVNGRASQADRLLSSLATLARESIESAFQILESSPQGLSDAEAQARLGKFGPNQISTEHHRDWVTRIIRAITNPLVLLLTALSIIAWATGDARAAIVMVAMVLIGVILRFVQETRADDAAAKLAAMIHVTAMVVRDGVAKELPLKQLAPGDVVHLSAGDMIPGDLRLISAKDLYLVESSLTGESMPVEKFDVVETRPDADLLHLTNICLLGTSVERGSGSGVIVATGPRTYFGSIARKLSEAEPPTSFDRGVARFTWMMIAFMACMVPLVFVINVATKHNWAEAFFFALAVAVGLTPEMLPMIVSVCLSKGAIAMSRKKVIVRRLNSIQNLGAMDVLCTDKTGTLTIDRVILERYCDVTGEESEDVLVDAYLISHLQTGLKSVLDAAVLAHRDRHCEWEVDRHRKVDEIPFDFTRRVMSVVVEEPDQSLRLLSKGAPEEMLKHCSHFELEGRRLPIAQLQVSDLHEEYESLSNEGFRVLAVAYRDIERKPAYGIADETSLVLRGYVAFLDPPKETAAAAIRALSDAGVGLKVLTGDNALVARKVCREVGLTIERTVLGSEIEAMNDTQLWEAAETNQLFARLSPFHKQRIIGVLQSRGHVVGFLGDGINDAPALHAADVGISVDSAVDIAKESASIILLEKSLLVLGDGVMEGRKVFSNVLKYVRMGASSSFGNMLSVLGASAFLPFLPMAPIQVLTNNLLYDASQIAIPTDEVDPEEIRKPRPWHIGDIRRFILWLGPVSSIFDYATFFVMLYIFRCWSPDRASLFQTGWFVESLVTQNLVIHVIRTNRIPFLQSRASTPMMVATAIILAIGIWLPVSPLARALGFVPLPASYWLYLTPITAAYLALVYFVKTQLIAHRRIQAE
jgi:Mg2+-importing ATPase